MPTLTLLAGPNGAGKTTFINHFKHLKLLPNTVINLDYTPPEIYYNLSGNAYSAEKEVQKLKNDFFLRQCNEAIDKNLDFAYECNLREEQLQGVKLFDDADYELVLIYMFLENIELSHDRVKQRVKEKGHHVSAEGIKRNFYEGLKNLDLTINEWNRLYLIDNSKNLELKENNLTVEIILQKGEIIGKEPNHINNLSEYLPELFKKLE